MNEDTLDSHSPCTDSCSIEMVDIQLTPPILKGKNAEPTQENKTGKPVKSPNQKSKSVQQTSKTKDNLTKIIIYLFCFIVLFGTTLTLGFIYAPKLTAGICMMFLFCSPFLEMCCPDKK